jgi:hypothetical protein
MSSQTIATNSEAAILARLIQSQDRDLAPEVGQYLLSFAFQPRDVERMNALAERAQGGELTAEESAELESYLHVGNLLAIMQAKARQFLRPDPQNQR